MKRYWLRIALGAFGIFILGMIVVSAGRRGMEHVKQVAMDQSFRLSPGVAPFRVDNRRLGTLSQVELEPMETRGFPTVNLTVQLDSGLQASGLSDCVLVARDASSLKGDDGLRCSADGNMDSLVEMGLVRFLPSEERVAIYVPASELEGKAWFDRVQRVSSAEAARAARQGSFDFRANAAGAFMLIKDEKGRPVFQLDADSTGAFIQIRDTNGRDVIRFRADSQGVEGRMH